MYEFLVAAHLVGVILLVGNVTITAFWKVLADMTRDIGLIRFAQRGVIIADWIFTLSGIVLVMVGGFGAALIGRWPLFDGGWLTWSLVLFSVSGILWLGILVPLQGRQARAARLVADAEGLPATYWRDARVWLIVGLIATVPLVAVLWLMLFKPF